MKIYGIMVIYNKSLKKAAAYESLIQSGIPLVICDNSTKESDNRELAEQNGSIYISMNGNQGLSKAYNRAISYIRDKLGPGKEDYVCFFDDDTIIPDEYFDRLKEQDGGIVLPIVKDRAGIMSPVRLNNKIVTRFPDKNAVFHAKRECLSGINSGMAVRMEIFGEFRYNEEMFLDYIDHMFIMEMRKQKIYPQVCDVELEQNFSALEDNKETAARRFALQKKDLRIFYGNAKAGYWFVVCKKHIKLAVKYRDLRMLFC
ncbi:MAG: glycosyltransferase [Alistipes sp.]|nr:glycosyltransferase [Alistipes sp.]